MGKAEERSERKGDDSEICVCVWGGVQPGPERQLKGKELGFLKKIQVRFLAPMSSSSQLPVTPARGDSKLLTSTGTYTLCTYPYTNLRIYT